MLLRILFLLGLKLFLCFKLWADFQVFAPCSQTSTLWIVKAHTGDQKFELKVIDKVNLGFNGRVITKHPHKPLLYVISTRGEEGKVPGAVIFLNEDGSYKSHTGIHFKDDACFLSLDKEGKHLLGISYGSGRLNVYPLDSDGIPGDAISTIDEGMNKAHCVLLPPDGKNLYIPYVKNNLALLQYSYDGDSGKISPLEPTNANPPEGTGPRHMAYHPTLPMVYFSNEQGVGLSVYHRQANGQLKVKQDINILPQGMSKIGLSASDLLITPDGKFLFAGLRGHKQNFDHISRYRVLEDGRAEFLGLTKAGKIPWGLTLSPDGKYLMVSATLGSSLNAYLILPGGNLQEVDSLVWDTGISDLITR